ncbi:MAG: DNA translocase FtsK 4TM domain-containing protein [Clostridia bacterium]|nr:DNA translocase FtsK 4TM domain-containing protein [Clostridia bacterium]
MATKKPAAKGTAAKKKTGTQQKSTASSRAAQFDKKEYTSEQLAARRQKVAIALMAVSVFLLCVAFIEGESLWLALHNGMFGLFGTSTYIWPIMLIYISIMFAMDKPLGSMTSNLIGVSAFVLLICSAIHLFSNAGDYLSAETIGTQIKTAWNDADLFPNSGAVGALIGGCLAKLAGKTGAAIVNVILLVVLAMFLTGTTLARIGKLISVPAKRVSEITDEKFEQGVARAKEREERRAEKREQEYINNKVKQKVSPKKESSINDRPFFVPSMPTDTAEDDGVIIGFGEDMPKEKQPQKEAAKAVQPIDDIINQVNAGQDKPVADKPEPELPPVKKPDVVPETVTGEPEEENSLDEASKKSYRLPPLDCLATPTASNDDNYSDELKSNAQKLLDTLDSFNVHAKITEISRGPSVTRYELQPDAGVRINKITNLSDDIALRLAAPGIRIEAPIPNKAAIGIEVPNRLRSMVYMREIIDTPQFKGAKSKLNVALGKDIAGNIICTDIAKMPHLLIAGTTGSGKSVCINTMIVSILYNATPDEVKLLMIDPKQVEFTVYNGIAHLAVPVVSDPRKASGALGWAVNEMQNRYKMFAEKNVRDIKGYNKLAEKDETIRPMHHIVIFIDELSDLMMVAPNEVEDAICRLAQMARAAGMHLVIATQRPSVDVITGIIKANIPSRIALSVSSQVDSRTILDMSGAEKLLGNGDMLFNPIGTSKPTRVQGCFISDEEVEEVVNFIKSQAESEYDEEIMTEIERQAAMAGSKKGAAAGADGDSEEVGDEMFPNAVEIVLDANMASTTLLQRKLKLGYARAARLMDELESKGIIGPFEGSKPRKVLITKQQWMEKCALSSSLSEDE